MQVAIKNHDMQVARSENQEVWKDRDSHTHSFCGHETDERRRHGTAQRRCSVSEERWEEKEEVVEIGGVIKYAVYKVLQVFVLMLTHPYPT